MLNYLIEITQFSIICMLLNQLFFWFSRFEIEFSSKRIVCAHREWSFEIAKLVKRQNSLIRTVEMRESPKKRTWTWETPHIPDLRNVNKPE